MQKKFTTHTVKIFEIVENSLNMVDKIFLGLQKKENAFLMKNLQNFNS